MSLSNTPSSLTHLPVGGIAHAGVGAAEEVGEEGVGPVLVDAADGVEEGGVGYCGRVPVECTSIVPPVHCTEDLYLRGPKQVSQIFTKGAIKHNCIRYVAIFH